MQSVLLVFLVSTAVRGAQVDYCDSGLCGWNDHTLCKYKPGPSEDCVEYKESRLSAEDKKQLLERLNKRRSDAASGRVKHLPPAADMLKLRWVEDLATEAQRWADRCAPPAAPEAHDRCRDLYSTTVGQCVASVLGESPGLKPQSMVDIWFMQNKHYIWSPIYIPSSGAVDYAEFAQTVWSKSFMVGCAMSTFKVPWRRRHRSVSRLVCNVAPRLPDGVPLWAPGPPATMCPPHSAPDVEFPGLCQLNLDTDEREYSDKNAPTLEQQVLANVLFDMESNTTKGGLDELYLYKYSVAKYMVGKPPSQSEYPPQIQKRDLYAKLSRIEQPNNHKKETDESFGSDIARVINEALKSDSTESALIRHKYKNIDHTKKENSESTITETWTYVKNMNLAGGYTKSGNSDRERYKVFTTPVAAALNEKDVKKYTNNEDDINPVFEKLSMLAICKAGKNSSDGKVCDSKVIKSLEEFFDRPEMLNRLEVAIGNTENTSPEFYVNDKRQDIWNQKDKSTNGYYLSSYTITNSTSNYPTEEYPLNTTNIIDKYNKNEQTPSIAKMIFKQLPIFKKYDQYNFGNRGGKNIFNFSAFLINALLMVSCY